MIFEDLLQEYNEVINLFEKEHPRRKNTKQKPHIDDKPQVIATIVAIIALTCYHSYRVCTYLSNKIFTKVLVIVWFAAIAIWMILDGRLRMKSSNDIKKEKKFYKKRLEKVNELLNSCGINTRDQIEALCIKAKQYKPNFLKAVLEYKKVLVFFLLQTGIPLVFFVLNYVAAKENYQSDIGAIIAALLQSTLNLISLYFLLMMLLPGLKIIFAKKLSLSESLAEDLELILILYPINQQVIQPNNYKDIKQLSVTKKMKRKKKK